jgi:DNA-binding transcriptional MerR regulator
VVSREYPQEAWAFRLKVAGYDPTPLGLEKLVGDLNQSRFSKKQLEDLGLHASDLSDLGKINKILKEHKVSTGKLEDWLKGWAIFLAQGVTIEDLLKISEAIKKEGLSLQDLEQFGEIKSMLKSRRVGFSVRNIEKLLAAYDDVNRYREEADEYRQWAGIATVLAADKDKALEDGQIEFREREERYEKTIESLRETKGSSGICYVATATLAAGGDDSRLTPLREWRDEVLRGSRIGRKFEEYYDEIGPRVAKRVCRSKRLSFWCLHLFVGPAVLLTRRRLQNSLLASARDVLVYAIFVSGLLYGRCLISGFSRQKE